MAAFSEEFRVKVVEMFKAGATAPAISKELGSITSSGIYRILNRAGISPLDEYRRGTRMHANRKITLDQEKEICQLYSSGGGNTVTIAKSYNVSERCIHKILQKNNIIMRRRGKGFRSFSDKEVADIISMYKSGLSQTKIAISHKTHQTTISRILLFNGIRPEKMRAVGEKHGSWRGGKVQAGKYSYTRLPESSPFYAMRGSNGYVADHRLAMAQHLGRCLRVDETVHHIDGDTTNNSIENLQLRTGNHGKHVSFRCNCCGSTDIVPVEI